MIHWRLKLCVTALLFFLFSFLLFSMQGILRRPLVLCHLLCKNALYKIYTQCFSTHLNSSDNIVWNWVEMFQLDQYSNRPQRGNSNQCHSFCEWSFKGKIMFVKGTVGLLLNIWRNVFCFLKRATLYFPICMTQSVNPHQIYLTCRVLCILMHSNVYNCISLIFPLMNKLPLQHRIFMKLVNFLIRFETIKAKTLND